jgi:hypothetical protein
MQLENASGYRGREILPRSTEPHPLCALHRERVTTTTLEHWRATMTARC